MLPIKEFIVLLLMLLSGLDLVESQCVNYITTLTSNCFEAYKLYMDTNNNIMYAACADTGENLISIQGTNSAVNVLTNAQCNTPFAVAVDDSTSTVFVACNSGPNTIISVRGNNSPVILATPSQFPHPSSVAFSGGIVYAGSFLSPSASVIMINTTNGNITTLVTQSQCNEPRAIAIDALRNKVYLACTSNDVIMSITGNNQPVLLTSQCVLPMDASLDPVSGILYVACDGSGIIAINSSNSNNVIITQLATFAQCGGYAIYFDPITGIVYASCEAANIIAIPPNTNQLIVLATPTQCSSPYGITSNGLTSTVYVACDFNIVAISGTTVTPVLTTAQCLTPSSIYANSSTGIVYVTCENGGTILDSGVVVIKGTQSSIFIPPSNCSYSTEVFVNPLNGLVYLSSLYSGIVVSDTINYPVPIIPQCFRGIAVAVDIIRNIVYAACDFSGMLSVSSNKSPVTIANVTICPNPSAIAVDLNTGIAYGGCTSGVISMNNSLVTVVLNTAKCSYPTAMAMDNIRRILYVACSNGVIAFTPKSGQSVIIPACGSSYPVTVFIDETHNILYVYCSSGPNTVVSISNPNSTSIALSVVTSSQCPPAFQAAIYPDIPTGVVYMTCNGGVFAAARNFACFSGYYWKLGTCTLCPTGTSKGPNQMICSDCALGTYSSSEGLTSCISCTAGFYTLTTGSTSCVQCGPGKYVPNKGYAATSCLNCPAGSYSLQDSASSSCAVCPPGLYCPLGSSISTAITCHGYSLYCPGNTSAPLTILPGYYGSDLLIFPDVFTNQTVCLPGFSCIGGTVTSCPSGYVTNHTGQSICYQCGLGRYAATNSSLCLNCPKGSVCVSGLLSNCGPGSYSDIYSTVCVKCSAGQYSSNATNSQCYNCTEGYYNPLEGASACVPCPLGTFANSPGSKACDTCSAGTQSVGSLCISCPFGKYQPVPGAAFCNACPLGFISNTINPISCIQCLIGYFSDSAASSCLNCSLGAICRNGIASDCGPGSYNNDQFSVQCHLCSQGQYSSNISNIHCNDCPIGSYSPIQGASICATCAGGTFNKQTGSQNCTTCPPGTSSPNGLICNPCPFGTFQPVGGADSCIPCFTGSISNTTNPIACITCPTGYYADSNQTSCLDCAPGSLCLRGFSTDCGPGTYNPSQFGVACLPCAAGTFNTNKSATNCAECDSGKFNQLIGSATCNLCPSGTFSNGTGQSKCTVCPVAKYSGGIQAVQGNSICSDCEPGTFSTIENAVVCSNCPIGRYSSSFASTTCGTCNSPFIVINGTNCVAQSYITITQDAISASNTSTLQSVTAIVIILFVLFILLSAFYVWRNNEIKYISLLIINLLKHRILDILQVFGVLLMCGALYEFYLGSKAENVTQNSDNKYNCEIFLWLYFIGYILHHSSLLAHTRAIMAMLAHKGDLTNMQKTTLYPAYKFVSLCLIIEIGLLIAWTVKAPLTSQEFTVQDETSQLEISNYYICSTSMTVFPVIQFVFALVLSLYACGYGLNQLVLLKNRLKSGNSGSNGNVSQELMSFRTQFIAFLPAIVLLFSAILNILLVIIVVIIASQPIQQFVKSFPMVVSLGTLVYVFLFGLLYCLSHFNEFQYAISSCCKSESFSTTHKASSRTSDTGKRALTSNNSKPSIEMKPVKGETDLQSRQQNFSSDPASRNISSNEI